MDSGNSESSDDSGTINTLDDEGWEDIEPDHEKINFTSLLDNEVFTDIQSMIRYCKEKYDFDFLETKRRLGLDFYSSIKLVNFIRAQTHIGKSIPSTLSINDFNDDQYMKPFMKDDAVLFSLDELPEILEDTNLSALESPEVINANDPKLALISGLEESLQRTRLDFENYRASVSHILNERWKENPLDGPSTENIKKKDANDDDAYYFSSYSHNDIHETMLKDSVRTDAYRDFIYQHKNLFAGKSVLDVGCGTGILSMFCAKAGSTHVFAVDNSAIIEKARENVFINGLDDKITCIWGKIEEVKLPVESVDIIVSEWMGYCLLYEAMLDSVIWARDKYLKPGGLIVPSQINMWVAPISDPDYIADHISFWRDVYGFDMKAMQAGIYDEALILDMPPNTICGEPYPFHHLNLYSITVKDVIFTKKWQSNIFCDIDSLDGYVIWFDTFFMPDRNDILPGNSKAEDWVRNGKKGIAFTTGPNGKPTHWKQGVVLIDRNKQPPVPLKAGREIIAEISYNVPEDNPRGLTIGIKWSVGEEARETQNWRVQ